MYSEIIKHIREIFDNSDGAIPLHEPKFIGNEKKYVADCIDSTFVSSVGTYVERFETITQEYTKSKKAIVCVNGTQALYLSLLMAGANQNCEVVTQPLTFIATANAIAYTGAKPVFVDVDLQTMGLSPKYFLDFLLEFGDIRDDGFCYNKKTNKKIVACVPMHTFGHPCKIDEIAEICKNYNIVLVEDAAESIGSKYKNQHTGNFGKMGVFSYNGNKTITTGGGGMIITNDVELAKQIKHLTTQAKIPHKWEFAHDFIGYNYRMPNINAALGVAQMENIDFLIENKRELAKNYKVFFDKIGIKFFEEPENSYSNYWLNSIILENKREQQRFLEYSNNQGVMTRPIWILMNKLDMFSNCQCGDLSNSHWFEDRVVNIPSSVRIIKN